MQVSFPLGITSINASDFERKVDSKIRGEQQAAPGQQTLEVCSPRIFSSFFVEFFLKIGSFHGSVTQN